MAEVTDSKDPNYVPERFDTFEHWMRSQNIPILRGFFADLNKVELSYWDLKGGPASFVVLDGSGGVNDGYVVEIPPGSKLKPQRHLFEEMVYVTKGSGSTTVWQRDGRKHSFEWGPGSMFAIPLNARYQHFNGSGIEPARLFSVTNACFMMNLFHNQDFIFDNEFAFLDRFDPSNEAYFGGEGEISGSLFMTTNFVPDTVNIKLAEYNRRGKGSTNLKFNLAGNTMGAHISEFPVGTYKKSHKHGPGAHVIILSGQGYSILWPEHGEDNKRKVDWYPGCVVVPPDRWFHQHFNSGATRARYLALRWHSWKFKFLSLNDEGNYSKEAVARNQIEFEDEDPQIHRDFEVAIEKAGAQCNMGDYHPFCTHKHALAG